MDGQEREAGPLLKEEAGEKGSQALRKWFQQLRMKERNQEVFALSPAGPASRPWSLLPSRLSPFPLTAHGLPLGPHVPVWDVVGNELTVPVATLSPSAPGDPTAHPRPGAVSGVGRAQVRGAPRPGPARPHRLHPIPPSLLTPRGALPHPEGQHKPSGDFRAHTPRGPRPPRLWTPSLAPLRPPFLLKEAEQERWHGWKVGAWGRCPPQPP